MHTDPMIRRARGQQLNDILHRTAARMPNKTALIYKGHTAKATPTALPIWTAP